MEDFEKSGINTLTTSCVWCHLYLVLNNIKYGNQFLIILVRFHLQKSKWTSCEKLICSRGMRRWVAFQNFGAPPLIWWTMLGGCRQHEQDKTTKSAFFYLIPTSSKCKYAWWSVTMHTTCRIDTVQMLIVGHYVTYYSVLRVIHFTMYYLVSVQILNACDKLRDSLVTSWSWKLFHLLS